MLTAYAFAMPPLMLSIAAAELDAATAPPTFTRLREVIDAAQQYEVQLDFGEVEFLDCAGIGGLITLNNLLDSHAGGMVLTRVRPHPCRVLGLTDLLQAFAVQCPSCAS